MQNPVRSSSDLGWHYALMGSSCACQGVVVVDVAARGSALLNNHLAGT